MVEERVAAGDQEFLAAHIVLKDLTFITADLKIMVDIWLKGLSQTHSFIYVRTTLGH